MTLSNFWKHENIIKKLMKALALFHKYVIIEKYHFGMVYLNKLK